MWRQYAGSVVCRPAPHPSQSQSASGGYSLHALLLNLDLHGCKLGVDSSQQPQLVGLCGIVAVVTPDTLVVVSKDDKMHGGWGVQHTPQKSKSWFTSRLATEPFALSQECCALQTGNLASVFCSPAVVPKTGSILSFRLPDGRGVTVRGDALAQLRPPIRHGRRSKSSRRQEH
jgi:RNase P/RNase MRP subunit p29